MPLRPHVVSQAEAMGGISWKDSHPLVPGICRGLVPEIPRGDQNLQMLKSLTYNGLVQSALVWAVSHLWIRRLTAS